MRPISLLMSPLFRRMYLASAFPNEDWVNTNVAKNVIIFVGDGMSIPTLTASRIYKAQYQGRQEGRHVNGEETLLTFEQFPNVGLSKVS